MRYLITGGCGFIGSNLAAEILKKGDELFILDNLYRFGSEKNLEWLNTLGKFKLYKADIRSYNDVENVITDCLPDVIFHLAGQVAMTTSLANPRFDFEVNVLGGINILECVRKFVPNAVVTYSSTNKVYGDLEWIKYQESDFRYFSVDYSTGFNETIPLDFKSPYGCSKGAVDQYMLDYSKMFDLNTIVFRHSSVFGGRQFSTEDQGWVGWFIQKGVEIYNKTNQSNIISISGNGKQVRDVLFVEDLVNCYLLAISNISKTKGNAFNIGGGLDNSLSLLELFNIILETLNIEIDLNKKEARKSDQKIFVSDNTKSLEKFGWIPTINSKIKIRNMLKTYL